MLMTIDEARQQLEKVLLTSTPTLFLGAGFSVGAESMFNTMEGDDLRNYIFDKLVDGKIEKDDYDEVKAYNLRRLCDEVYSIYGRKQELMELLTRCFKNTRPSGNRFHLKLTNYPWKKIYTVNIDDLVENVYAENGKEIVVQNSSKLRNCDDKTELYKLHGCVNNVDEGYIFSEEEYRELITRRLDAKLNSFTMEIQNNDIIFIGASMDEPDIDYYLKVYSDAGCKYRNNKLIFVDYNPSHYLKQYVQKLDAILIKASAEEFLNLIAEINFKPDAYQTSKINLNYHGISCLSDIAKLYENPYESKLYEGNFCKWQDVQANWVFENSNYQKAICELDRLLDSGENINCFSIYGPVFAGKSCLLKQLGYYLFNKGYDVLEYKGRYLDKRSIFKYIDNSPASKFVLIIDGGSYYYEQIENMFKIDIHKKQLVILTASREYYHKKKRYYLMGNSFYEFRQNDIINKNDAQSIRKTLDDKSHLSYMSSLTQKQQAAEILQQKSMVNLIVKLTYGSVIKKIKNSYKKTFDNFDELEKQLLTELVIFDVADIEIYPRELFTERYGRHIKVDNNIGTDNMRIIDYVRMDTGGLSLRNEVINDYIINTRSDDIKDILISILKFLSKLIVEKSNDTWYIIFQCLLKEDVLENKLKLNFKNIKDIYFSLKEEYKDISYYWLQLGLFEQKNDNYISAYNYLEKSASIRPNSYKIQHAIARNYMRHANNIQNSDEALRLFDEGERRMKELIESKEYFKEKAKPFSVNCYIIEKIKFLKKFDLEISNSEIRYMNTALNSVQNAMDPYMEKVFGIYYAFMEQKNKLSLLNIDLDSPYIKFVGSDNSLYLEEDIIDPVVEAIN